MNTGIVKVDACGGLTKDEVTWMILPGWSQRH